MGEKYAGEKWLDRRLSGFVKNTLKCVMRIEVVSIGEKSMAIKEWRIPFNEISDPQKVTQRNIQEFEKHGENIHTLEVEKIEDDHSSKQRILRVRPRKYFGPWTHRG